jgi:hypothetical protein
VVYLLTFGSLNSSSLFVNTNEHMTMNCFQNENMGGGHMPQSDVDNPAWKVTPWCSSDVTVVNLTLKNQYDKFVYVILQKIFNHQAGF